MWQADGVCQVLLRQVIRILVCHGRRIIGGKSMGDQVSSSHHWEQGCTNKLYNIYIYQRKLVFFKFPMMMFSLSKELLTFCVMFADLKCCSHLQPFSEQTWYLQVKIPSNSEFLLALGTIFPKVHIKK